MITDPSALDEARRRSFGRALFSIHRQIFESEDFSAFYAYVVDSPALRTQIETYHDRQGALVGYCAMHTFEREFGRRRVRVHRVETGLLGAYRGRGRCANFLAREFTRALLSAGRKQHYFFGCLVHPSSYCGLSRHIDRIWPHPERATPPELLAFMGALADDFNLRPVAGRDPLVREVGWVTREHHDDRERWRRNEDPRAVLYMRKNPDYSAGLGMITLFPVTVGGVISGFCRNVLYKARRRLSRLWGRASTKGPTGAQSQALRPRDGSGLCPDAAR